MFGTIDLVGRKLNNSEDFADDGFHPSGKVWDILIVVLDYEKEIPD